MAARRCQMAAREKGMIFVWLIDIDIEESEHQGLSNTCRHIPVYVHARAVPSAMSWVSLFIDCSVEIGRRRLRRIGRSSGCRLTSLGLPPRAIDFLPPPRRDAIGP